MDNRIVHLPLQVDPFTEDYLGMLSWGVLGNLLLRVSEIHAAANGFGFDAITKRHKAWVLSRLTIEMQQRPKTYENFTLSTWVANYFRQFSTRHYALRAPDDTPLGYGTSVWALIDTETREPVSIDDYDTEGVFSTRLIADEVPLAEPIRIRMKETEPTIYMTAYSDLDINGHVNSIRYIQLLLNLFPQRHYDMYDLRRLDVTYAKECYCGEELHLYSEAQGEGRYATTIRNAVGEVAVKAMLHFAPRQ